MNQADEQFVYHGSHESFDVAIPKRNIRKKIEQDGSITVNFDDISFHATPYRWIALSYTGKYPEFERDGKKYHYTTGVNLKKYVEEVTIYGVDSIEESMQKIYGDGGYLLKFDKKDFFTKPGLGILELIVQSEIKPISIERIDDPVAELKKLGIEFKFVDLTKEPQWFS